ncbi:hypothetical protein HJD18_12305 [Thermoleophilia bacterium SCSIO 60948]|nr:hypothetical protein HJD18_12305 [Thermoleophilia bacterium SCSIO 60948]
MIRRALLAAVAICLAALLAGVPATQAKSKPRKQTTLVLEYAPPSNIGGKVKSVAPCRRDRTILLYEVINGSAEKIDQTRSKQGGNYIFDPIWPVPGAQYEAVTFQKRTKRVICKGDNSPRITPVGEIG